MADPEETRHIFGQIDDLPPPCDSLHLFAHQDILRSLVQSYKTNRLHHAILLCGPQGIGKSTLAFHFARHILAHPDPEQAPSDVAPSEWPNSIISQVSQSVHPQLLHLTRAWDEKTKKFKTQLSVDDIRKAQGFYQLTSGDGGFRITIIDSADDMNTNAANALLKILEEPPQRSLFIVIAHAPGSLLPTIRSRCQRLDIPPLSQELVVDALSSISPTLEIERHQQSARLSAGSVRRALEVGRGDVLDYFAKFESLMTSNAKGDSTDWNGIHDLSDSLSGQGNESDYKLFCELVMEWLRHNVREQSSQSNSSSLVIWAELWEKLQSSIIETDIYNLDRKQVILSLFHLFFEKNREYG